MSIYCPLSEALGIDSGGQSVLNQNDDFIVYDPTISSQEAIKRNSEFVTCPHCGVSGNRPNMIRWHFDNCKTKLKDCPQCGKVISRQGCKDSLYKKKVYCSQECYIESKKGKSPIDMTPEVRGKISKAALRDSQNRSERMKKVQPWKIRWNISE
jgi:hypothetical protein